MDGTYSNSWALGGTEQKRVRRRNNCRSQKALCCCIGSRLLVGSVGLMLRRSCKYDTSHYVPHRKHCVCITKRSRLKCFNPLKSMQTIHVILYLTENTASVLQKPANEYCLGKWSLYSEESARDVITFSERNAEFVMFKYVVRIVTTVL